MIKVLCRYVAPELERDEYIVQTDFNPRQVDIDRIIARHKKFCQCGEKKDDENNNQRSEL